MPLMVNTSALCCGFSNDSCIPDARMGTHRYKGCRKKSYHPSLPFDIQSKRLYVLAPGSSVNLCDKSKSGVGGGEDLVTAKS